MASSVPEIVKNIEAEGNKMEKQFASLTLTIPNTHLTEKLTPLSEKEKENIDAMDCDQQIASLTSAIPNTHLNKELTPLSDKDKENTDTMDCEVCDQQIDVPNQLPPMKPESYRYLGALSNEEYEDLLKYTASRRL